MTQVRRGLEQECKQQKRPEVFGGEKEREIHKAQADGVDVMGFRTVDAHLECGAVLLVRVVSTLIVDCVVVVSCCC